MQNLKKIDFTLRQSYCITIHLLRPRTYWNITGRLVRFLNGQGQPRTHVTLVANTVVSPKENQYTAVFNMIRCQAKFLTSLHVHMPHASVMESRDLVSLSRPIFASLGLEGSGFENLHIAKKLFIKISIIQIFLFVVFAGKKKPNHAGKTPENWKNSSQKHGRPQKLFQGGKLDILLKYPFHVADDAVQTHVHKTLCPFYTITKMPPATLGETRRSRGEQPVVALGECEQCNRTGPASLGGPHLTN